MLDETNQNVDLVTRLFDIEMESTTKNMETDAEPEQKTMEHINKLSCHIDNDGKPIDNLTEGLNITMAGQVEKYSDVLGRNCTFNKTQKVNKLPSYLCVQFVRFYWKKESNVGGTKAVLAKILRSVMYPKVFDIYNHCSDELKKSLDLGREFEQKLREEADNAKLEGKKQQAKEFDKEMTGEKEAETEDQKEEKRVVGKALKAQEQLDALKEHDRILYRPHGTGLDTGNYELVAVVTHKGRSAEGGHYVGWAHQEGETWLQFDDDIVTTVKADDILALRGGGDWHTAYLCMYRKIEASK